MGTADGLVVTVVTDVVSVEKVCCPTSAGAPTTLQTDEGVVSATERSSPYQDANHSPVGGDGVRDLMSIPLANEQHRQHNDREFLLRPVMDITLLE